MAADVTRNRLIGQRAEALAVLLLTDVPGLKVLDVTRDDIGVDFLVQIATDRKGGLRQFGVEVKGTLEGLEADRAKAILEPALRGVERYGPFPFPVAVFVFSMQNDAGWYTWAAEPVVAPGDRAYLRTRADPECRPLTGESVRDILDQVNGWYDAHYRELSAGVSGGKRGTKT